MKFVTLIKYTNQGIRNIQHTARRAEEFRTIASQVGVEITELLWLTGRFDGLMVLNSPDSETTAALMLQLSKGGDVTTETLQAFDTSRISEILDRSNAGEPDRTS